MNDALAAPEVIAPSPTAARSRLAPGVRELGLLGLLYVAYSVVRSLASDNMSLAVGNARAILEAEHAVWLDFELAVNEFFVDHRVLSVASSFFYASAHFVVTGAILVWLWRTRREHYRFARTALAAATVVALVMYLLLPTAPPRLYGGYVDVLHLTSDVGWWGASASSPKGFSGMTNELAAMPSMHVGWAFWCALAVATATRSLTVRILVWIYPTLTAIVVVGTGNHWTLDVIAGIAVVAAAWWTMRLVSGYLAQRSATGT